jgi:DNA modification methylase
MSWVALYFIMTTDTWNDILGDLANEAYYREPAAIIFNADCLDILPKLPKVDLVLTDPPYGVSKDKWDNFKYFNSLMKTFGTQITDNINSSGILICFSSTRNLDILIKQIKLQYRWMFIWYASNNMAYGDMGFQKFTPALIFGEGKIYNNSFQDLKAIPIIPQKIGHPTPKPLPLISYLVNKMNRNLILDPFLGSGTTAVAAKNLGRKCIGIEIEKKYCDIAIERLRQEVLL